jgi:hypothetical protein
MQSTLSPTKAARGLKFINTSMITTRILRRLASRCTGESETSRGENGPRSDFKSRKNPRRRTFRGNPTQDRGGPPFIGSYYCSLSWNRNINRLSSPSICTGDEVLPSPIDCTHVNSGSTSGQGRGFKNHAGDPRKSYSLKLSFSFYQERVMAAICLSRPNHMATLS